MAKKNTDTVPAMLTPGEFVIKKKSAKKIGYDKLNQMNKTGKIVSKSKKSKGKKMAKAKKKYQFGGVVKPPMVKPPGQKASPSDMAFELTGVGAGGLNSQRARGPGKPGQRSASPAGMPGYKKGGKVKASGGYKIVGQRKGYKVGE
tara:strand:- start:195 stop:632 length:438 start_codon:yes stop_codon:yes gene_type:complete